MTDHIIHLPESCPACYAPILKWRGATLEPIGPETADYGCGLSLVHRGSVKDPTATEPCCNAYETAVNLRKVSP